MPEPSSDLLPRFLEAANREAALDPAEGAVLALSGGPDSTALLDLFRRAGTSPDRLVAAHLDHAMRPESRQDALFVADQARAAGIRCRCRRRDVAALAAGANIEEAARTLRYEFLGEVARDSGLPVVATGHHLDDQAETVLMRIVRGTGPGGLASIAPSRPLAPGHPARLVRPLLPFTREEIVAYLAGRGLPYRIDPTNLDGGNFRSRVRTRLLPLLRREVPDLAARLAALAGRARELPAAEPVGDLSRTGGALRARLRAMLPADGPAIDRGALDRVAGVVARGRGAADLAGGWTAIVSRGEIHLLPPGGPPLFAEAGLACPGEVTLPDGCRIRAEPAATGKPSSDPNVEVVDAAAAAGALRIRPAAEDGPFHPFGAQGETTILRFLKSQAVPERVRRGVPVVWAGTEDRPVWIVGYRIDARVAIGPGTEKRIRLTATSCRPSHRP